LALSSAVAPTAPQIGFQPSDILLSKQCGTGREVLSNFSLATALRPFFFIGRFEQFCVSDNGFNGFGLSPQPRPSVWRSGIAPPLRGTTGPNSAGIKFRKLHIVNTARATGSHQGAMDALYSQHVGAGDCVVDVHNDP
jgi:hypothetical protein